MSDSLTNPITPAFSSAPVQALQIVALTGFGAVSTVLGYVFLPPAGFLIALPFVWKGTAWITGQSPQSGPIAALSIVMDTGLALIATILGFVFLPPAGLILAALFLWRIVSAGRAVAEAPAAQGPAPTGNRAFDTYKADTLKRLEDEQSQFEDFLARLRDARDKAEFDRFMEDRLTDTLPRVLPEPPARPLSTSTGN